MIHYRPPNCPVEFRLPNMSCMRLYAAKDAGIPERELIEWAAKELMPAGKVFVDIGANVGSWSLMFSYLAAPSRIVAFEPWTSSRRCLEAAVEANHLVSLFVICTCALGAEPAHAVLQQYNPNGEEGSFHWHRSDDGRPVLAEEAVEVRTLDSFALGNVGLLKIDTEGAELDVLRGAEKTLERNGWPTILFEAIGAEWFAPRKAATFAWLTEHGYKVGPTSMLQMHLAIHGR